LERIVLETIICPHCRRRLLLPEETVGMSVQCPGCRAQFTATVGGMPTPLVLAPAPIDDLEPREDLEPIDDLDQRVQGGAASLPAPRPELPRRKKQPRRPAPSGGRKLGWVIAGMLTLAALGSVLLIVLLRDRVPVQREFKDKRAFPAQRAVVAEGAAAAQPPEVKLVRDQQPLAAEQIAAETQPLFDALGKSFRDRDGAAIASHFDADRMVDELFAQGFVPNMLPRDRRDLVRILYQRLGPGLLRSAAFFEWTATEVRHVNKLEGNEAEIMVRHQSGDGILRVRWWVTKRQGFWQVFDFEELNLGMRFSSAMAAIKEVPLGDMRQVGEAAQQLADAMQDLVVKQDVNAADLKLQRIAGVKLPAKIEGVRQMATANVRFVQGKFEEALAAASKAHAAHPGMPGLSLLKGRVHSQLGQWQQAVEHLNEYSALLGDDADVCAELGIALQQLGRAAEAAAQFRKSLDYRANQLDMFLRLLQARPWDDDQNDVGPRFLKLADPRAAFNACADDRRQARDANALEQLAAAMETVDPRLAPAFFYHALAKAWNQRPDQAIDCFHKALGREKDAGQRRDFTEGFVRAMASSGHAMNAYDVVADKREAFRWLADDLKVGHRHEELAGLVGRHEKGHPDDPLLPLYRAELLTFDEDFAGAEKAFAMVLAKPHDAALVAGFRSSRVLAKYHTGQALAALAEIGPRRDTLQQLIWLCWTSQDYALAQRLLDAEAQAEPASADVAMYRVQLKIRQNQVADAVALFKKNLAGEPNEQRRQEFVNGFLFAMVDRGHVLPAYGAAPDPDTAFQTLANDLLDQGRSNQLPALIEAHRQKRPRDSWLVYYQAEKLIEDGAWAKAAELLAAGRKTAPDNLRPQMTSSYVFAMYKAGRGLEAYAADPSKETFARLASDMCFDKKGAELEALLAAHALRAGQDADLLNYAARAKLFAKKPAEAGPLFLAACQKQALPFKRTNYAREFLLGMAELGQWREAYLLVPDKTAALQVLGGRFVSRKQEEELAALLREVGPQRAADPWFQYYQAQLSMLRGDFQAADKTLTAAQKQAAGRDQWTFRAALYRARVRTGQTVPTYHAFETTPRILDDLARCCVDEKNPQELAALLDAHRLAHPNHPNALLWDVELLWLKQDYTGIHKFLTEQAPSALVRPATRWRAHDCLVRSLVKLQKNDEAVKWAKDLVDKKRGSPVLLILAHAATGNVARTMDAVAEHERENRYLVQDCYRDADLGPVLKSGPFQDFRARYPEVKTPPFE
jgi:tetratricopeptide (TPR) repeat protein